MSTQNKNHAARQLLLPEHHAKIERLLRDLLLEASPGEDEDVKRECFTAFHNALDSHLDAEERWILPKFELVHPDEAKEIRSEHEAIRAQLTRMGIDADLRELKPEHVEELTALLRRHAQNEDRILYPWAVAHLSGSIWTEIAERIAQVVRQMVPRPSKHDAASKAPSTSH